MSKPIAMNSLFVLLLVMTWAPTAVAQTQAEVAPAAEIFVKADANSDKALSREEYEALRGTTPEVRRDFLVFDLNADQVLNAAEFASIPSIAGTKRGPIPDPFAAVVDQLLTIVKEQAAEKGEAGEEAVFRTARFLVEFQKVLQERPPARVVLDPDLDGTVTLEEGKRFFEIQLGIRRADGQRLRFDDGRLVNNNLFLYADLNANDVIERQEFVERSFGGPNVEDEFNAADADKDNQLTLDEWCTVPGRSVDDPVLNFLRSDTNLDGLVDPDELQNGMVEWKRPMLRNVSPAFDLNKDGKLSLTEFRQILPENMVAPWHNPVNDKNADEVISLDEFQFDRCTFSLLRRLYFTRMDLNGNGTLEPDEFSFKIKMHDVFFTLNADGTDWKQLYEFKDHHACGSVTVSPDGKTIAFDSWIGVNQRGSALYTMDINGGEPQQICQGMMPSWSADGKSLAFSFSSQGADIWLTSLDGEREGLANGWGAQFNPDGTRLAFNVGNEIHAMDVATGDEAVLLQGDENPYRSIYWNSTWSPDGKRLCFKGVRPDGTVEVASILTSGDEPDLRIHHSGKVHVNADFAWHPGEDRVVFAMHSAERNMVQLFQFNPNTTEPPVLVAGQDATQNNTDACWTPDGKRLIVISGDY